MGFLTWRRVGKVKKEVKGLRHETTEQRQDALVARSLGISPDEVRTRVAKYESQTPEQRARQDAVVKRNKEIKARIKQIGWAYGKKDVGREYMVIYEFVVYEGLTLDEAFARRAELKNIQI
jgi:hypothetical protein